MKNYLYFYDCFKIFVTSICIDLNNPPPVTLKTQPQASTNTDNANPAAPNQPHQPPTASGGEGKEGEDNEWLYDLVNVDDRFYRHEAMLNHLYFLQASDFYTINSIV